MSVSSPTTFSELIASPATQKKQLVEIELGESLEAKGFVQDLLYTNIWTITYLYEEFTLNGIQEKIIKQISRLEAMGIALAKVSGMNAVNVIANTYWHDVPAKQLHVNIGGDPAAMGLLIGYFYIYFSSTPDTVFNSNYYQPYIKSIPNISQAASSIFNGLSQVGAGRVIMNNDTGFFDSIMTKFIWENRRVVVKYGGESLPYTEYNNAFIGVIESKSWSEREAVFYVKSTQIQLLRTIPEQNYSSTVNPAMDSSKAGSAIPIAYGIFDERTAPVVTAINEAVGVHQVQFQLTSHDNFSIDGVWIDYGTEEGWQPAIVDQTFQPADLLYMNTINKYKVDDSTNKTITVLFSGEYTSGSTRVKVAFKGRKLGAALMTSSADIIQDLLTNYNSFTLAALNTAEFTTAKEDSKEPIAVYIESPTRTSDIISKICVSTMGFFYVDKDGLFAYKIWNPGVPAFTYSLDETDILKLNIKFEATEHYGKIKVGYSQAQSHQNYLFRANNDTESELMYGINKQRILHTYLTEPEDADFLMGKHLWLSKSPTATVELITKWKVSPLNVGDKIRLTVKRAPESSTGAYTLQAFQIKNISKNYNTGTISIVADDLGELGLTVGIITADTAPDWLVATANEKLISGFITDDAGLADPADPASKNQSIIW